MKRKVPRVTRVLRVIVYQIVKSEIENPNRAEGEFGGAKSEIK